MQRVGDDHEQEMIILSLRERSASRGGAVAFMVHHLETDDFDTFKSRFDADPVGRKQAAKGHVMLRSVDNPNEVFVAMFIKAIPIGGVGPLRQGRLGRGPQALRPHGKIPVPGDQP